MSDSASPIKANLLDMMRFFEATIDGQRVCDVRKELDSPWFQCWTSPSEFFRFENQEVTLVDGRCEVTAQKHPTGCAEPVTVAFFVSRAVMASDIPTFIVA